MEDHKIIGLLWQRCDEAITALQQKFGADLHRLAMNILDDPQDAEEAQNDTYLALWNAIPPARPDPLAAFVYRTGRNISLNILRRRHAQKRDDRYDVCLEELSGILPGDDLEQALDARALGRAIDGFLQTLDKDSRVLFVRRYWFGDTPALLAQQHHISTNTVTVRLHRIRTRLKHYLIKEGFWHEA